MHRTLVYLLLIIVSSPILSQDFMIDEDFEQSLLSQHHSNKIYLQTDRLFYSYGDDVLFKVYATSNDLLPIDKTVVEVELINDKNEVQAKRRIKIINGVGTGDFALESNISGGKYLIKAYSGLMLHYDDSFHFRKAIFVKSPFTYQSDISESDEEKVTKVSFYQEGGDLISGVSSRIGVMSNGSIEDGKLQILNSKGIVKHEMQVSSVLSFFEFTPSEQETYKAVLTSGDQSTTLDFPQAKRSGAHFEFKSIDEKVASMHVLSNQSLDEWMVIGHVNGRIVYTETLSGQDEVNLKIDLSSAPIGLIHFTLLDPTGTPWSERLIFNNIGLDDYYFEVGLDQTEYKPTETGNISIEAFDDDGESLISNIHLALTRSELANTKPGIAEYFYLQSDLPSWNPLKYHLIDDVEKINEELLAYGWRRFKWRDLKKGKVAAFQAEPNLTVKGQTVKPEDKNKPVKSYGLVSRADDLFSAVSFETDDNGWFDVALPDFYGDSDFVFQAVKAQKKNKPSKDNLTLKGDKNVDILIQSKSLNEANQKDSWFLISSKFSKEGYQNTSKNVQVNGSGDDFGIESSMSVEIEEITVKAERLNQLVAEYEETMMYSTPDDRVLTSTMPALNQYNDLYDILRVRARGISIEKPREENPGTKKCVLVRGGVGGISSSTKGKECARFMVNGSVVSTPYAENIPPSEIAFIDVIRSHSKLSLFGELGNSGIIAIYLKTPAENLNREKPTLKGVINHTLSGFSEAREFADIRSMRTAGNDQNYPTVLWIPNIQIDQSGESQIQFDAPSQSGTYRLLIEGMTSQGVPLFHQSEIVINE